MKNIILFLIVFFLGFRLGVYAQTSHNQVADCILEYGLQELGKPYVGGTLDVGCSEVLICDTEQYDCVTFVEYILAKARLEVYGKTDETLTSQLIKLRYKDGLIAGYGSRLHYFRSWILQGVINGYVMDITGQIGGRKLQKNINYMSLHREKYPKMKGCNGDEAKLNLAKIVDIERVISKSEYYEIPKSEVTVAMANINPGDIIAFATQIAGLDVVHTGFAIRLGGKIHLLHASSQEMKVVVSTLPLDLYVAGNKSQSGIIVVRPR